MQKTTILKFLVIAIFISISGANLIAIEKGTITGKVTAAASGIGLPGVNVQLIGTLLGASTDRSGFFVINLVPEGVYAIRATMIGRRPQQLSGVQVMPGDTVAVSFSLEETVIDFDPLIVSASKTQKQLDATASSVSVIQS
ncbi:MAG: carboxypeptidase regulatory-like domain-containing protein, partial [bacterium]|nr:carboxypeptidase regulatory-like domain-containing protein [bacterium]